MPYTVRLNGRTVATFEQRRKLWRGHAPFCETTRTRSASDPHCRFVANEATG
jgi:hypothetical protein